MESVNGLVAVLKDEYSQWVSKSLSGMSRVAWHTFNLSNPFGNCLCRPYTESQEKAAHTTQRKEWPLTHTRQCCSWKFLQEGTRLRLQEFRGVGAYLDAK